MLVGGQFAPIRKKLRIPASFLSCRWSDKFLVLNTLKLIVFRIFSQSLEVEMDLPFDDVRDNPEGQGKPSADIGGLWKPLAFVERLPDIFVKVYKVYICLLTLFTLLVSLCT